MNIKFVSNPKISPDGKYVVYSKVYLAPEDEGKKYRYYELWVRNLETGESKLYATKEESTKEYVWSKDSKYLYFLSKHSTYQEKLQIFKMPVNGGVAQLVTEHPAGIVDFVISKKQDKIVFIENGVPVYAPFYLSGDIYAKKAEIDKNRSLHTLRHSIATHLLKSGMSLENISRFLGHRSLESTQIYTHVVNEQV